MPKGRLVIKIEKCKGCGLCVMSCPTKSLELSKEFNALGHRPVVWISPEKCTGCGICARMCPDCVIEVYKEG